jgi:glycosyltransferase involved in cell wall biosynthesis
MDYRPNVDGVLRFATDCWPHIRERFADARFLVVGSQPVASVRALEGKDGIEVSGRVPETAPWFDRAALAIAPLRLARGIQNKVLEAMSMGLPVVCSPAAAEGLEAALDRLLVASDDEKTVESVCRLMENPQLARQLGQRAADFVRQHYRWQDMLAIFDREVDRLIKRPEPGQVSR